MIVIRDENRLARLRTIGTWANFIGLGVLVAGLLVSLINDSPQLIFVAFLAIPVGWLVSQAGIYLTQRYVRSPRPDEVLDEELGRVARGGRMYHYVLPAPHVLLTRSGVIVFITKHQVGNISYENGKWRQRKVGLVRRIFGQEAVGNPTREAEGDLQKMVRFIKKHAPEVEEVPMGAMIVFTTKNMGQLDTDDAPFPTVYYSKLKGAFKKITQGAQMPEQDYATLRAAFDEQAGDLVTEA